MLLFLLLLILRKIKNIFQKKPTKIMEIKVSVGEVFDKLSILEIKKNKLTDADKLLNVQKEYDYLNQVLDSSRIADSVKFNHFYNQLLIVNTLLWDIEDGKRACERTQDFGEHFVQLARQVYIKNDQRAAIKKEINTYYRSEFTEEKSYAKYD
jgi:hypothetical protein